jgi:hypothetical protein
MRNVLQAFAKRNPMIGYCQGMNFIVGRLMKHTKSEESTFWLFTMLIENILPLNYYTQMVGVRVEVKVFDKLIEHYLPKVYRHLLRYQFETLFFSLNWFICLFCDKLDEKASFSCLILYRSLSASSI